MAANIHRSRLKLYRDTRFRYWLNGRRIPGTTEVLKDQGLIDDRFFSPESQSRGRAVHHATRLLDEGRLRWWTVDECLVGYIRSYQKALASTRYAPSWLLSEHPQHHAQWGYATTPDRIGAWPGIGWALWELKTGALYDAVALQTIAQKDAVASSNLLQPGTRLRRFGVSLRRDGAMPKIHEYTNDAHDRGVFLGALSAMKWRIAHGLIEGY